MASTSLTPARRAASDTVPLNAWPAQERRGHAHDAHDAHDAQFGAATQIRTQTGLDLDAQGELATEPDWPRLAQNGMPWTDMSSREAAPDSTAWEQAWTTSEAAQCQGHQSIGPQDPGVATRFTLELRTWGRLDIDCYSSLGIGWQLSIASDDEEVRRTLRGHVRDIRSAVKQWFGHDDVRVVIRP